MPYELLNILTALPAFALILFRLSGLMMTAPLYGSSVVPLRIRAAFTLAVAAVLFPVIRSQAPADLTLTAAIAGGVCELMIGASIGLSLTILISAAQVAGTLIGQQGGFALSEVINPFQEAETTVIDQLYAIVLMMVFLAAGGLTATLAALMDTYRTIPMLSYQPGESPLLLLVEMLSASFMVGIRVAGPVVIALFLTESALGLVSRTVPQLNILSVGFGIRSFMVLLAAGLSLMACQGVLLEAVWDGLEMIRAAFGLPPDP